MVAPASANPAVRGRPCRRRRFELDEPSLLYLDLTR